MEHPGFSGDSSESRVIGGWGVVRITGQPMIGRGGEGPLGAFKRGETGWELHFGAVHGNAPAKGKAGGGRKHSEKGQCLGERYESLNWEARGVWAPPWCLWNESEEDWPQVPKGSPSGLRSLGPTLGESCSPLARGAAALGQDRAL